MFDNTKMSDMRVVLPSNEQLGSFFPLKFPGGNRMTMATRRSTLMRLSSASPETVTQHQAPDYTGIPHEQAKPDLPDGFT
jgi:hypothetical protein